MQEERRKVRLITPPTIQELMEKNRRLEATVWLLVAALVTWIGVAGYVLLRGCS